MKYPNKNWNWFNLKIGEYSEEFIVMFKNKNLNWGEILYHAKITTKSIKNNPDVPWNWVAISSNKNITIDDVENNPDFPWNWLIISRNIKITLNFVKKFERKIDWNYISDNSNVTLDIIEAFLDKPWNWNYLSSAKIPAEFVIKHKNKEWKLTNLILNPNIHSNAIKHLFFNK